MQICAGTSLHHKKLYFWKYLYTATEVRFASFLSGGFTTMAVMNPLEKKLEKRTGTGTG
jgi:hypothetical protein